MVPFHVVKQRAAQMALPRGITALRGLPRKARPEFVEGAEELVGAAHE